MQKYFCVMTKIIIVVTRFVRLTVASLLKSDESISNYVL